MARGEPTPTPFDVPYPASSDRPIRYARASDSTMDFDVDALSRKLKERAEVSRSSAAAGPTPQQPPIFTGGAAGTGGGGLRGNGGAPVVNAPAPPHGNGHHATPEAADVAADFSDVEKKRLEVRATLSFSRFRCTGFVAAPGSDFHSYQQNDTV